MLRGQATIGSLKLGCADEIKTRICEDVATRHIVSFISMDLVRCVVPSSCGVHGRTVSAIILDRLNAVSIRAALSAALAVCLIPMGTAQAEPFGPQYRSWEGYDYAPFSPPDRGMGDSEPLSQKRQRAHTKHDSRPKAESQRQRAHTIDESRPKAESQRQRAPEG
jgi:hypothetical protein